MNLIIEQAQGRVPITIVRVQGDLDAASYQSLIAKVQELYKAGTRTLLLDMSGIPYIGSSGLVALHSAALLMRGERSPDPEEGWRALRAVGEAASEGLQRQVKLLRPQPQVQRVIENTGLQQFFEIHTDEATAVASF